jgi:uncharacterized membrane protein YkgB
LIVHTVFIYGGESEYMKTTENQGKTEQRNERPPAPPGRHLEQFVLGLTVVLVFVGTLVGLLQGIGIVLGIAGGLLAVGSPVLAAWLIYRDAAIIASYETDWSPDPTKYAIATVLLGPTILVPNLFTNALAPAIGALQSAYSGLVPAPEGLLISKFSLGLPLVAVYYLYQRNRYLGSAVIPSYRSWWVVLPVVTLVGLLSLPVVGVRPELGLVVHHGVGLLLAGIPIAAYLDAAYLSAHSEESRWNPNPALHLYLGYLSIVYFPLSFLYPTYVFYYVIRRLSGRPR